MRCVGVDGARGGWVLAGDDGGVEVVASLDDLFEDVRSGRVAAVAVDMPIGLPAAGHGPRRCDVDARRLLGPRRASVFPTPPRRFLHATDFADVTGLSLQAFHLLARIAELDALVDPTLQDRVVESHPELAFARLDAGRPLAAPKRTPEGLAHRAALVGLTLDDVPRRRGARADDVLDALALVRTAIRIADGTAERLGDGTRDERGLRMEIAW